MSSLTPDARQIALFCFGISVSTYPHNTLAFGQPDATLRIGPTNTHAVCLRSWVVFACSTSRAVSFCRARVCAWRLVRSVTDPLVEVSHSRRRGVEHRPTCCSHCLTQLPRRGGGGVPNDRNTEAEVVRISAGSQISAAQTQQQWRAVIHMVRPRGRESLARANQHPVVWRGGGGALSVEEVMISLSAAQHSPGEGGGTWGSASG